MQMNFSLGWRKTCKPLYGAGFLPLTLPDLCTSLMEDYLDTMLQNLQVSLSISAASRNHTPQGKGSKSLVSFIQTTASRASTAFPD